MKDLINFVGLRRILVGIIALICPLICYCIYLATWPSNHDLGELSLTVQAGCVVFITIDLIIIDPIKKIIKKIWHK